MRSQCNQADGTWYVRLIQHPGHFYGLHVSCLTYGAYMELESSQGQLLLTWKLDPKICIVIYTMTKTFTKKIWRVTQLANICSIFVLNYIL